MKRIRMASSVFLVALVGCTDVIDLDPVDDTPPVEARVRPKPISGGTLMVTSDGLAVAADPDRDRVYVVEIEGRVVRHTIALEPDDEPGRVVAGSKGLAHVVLRGFGGVAAIDLASGRVVARHRLCSDPRGLAFESETSMLHVACADGTLLQLAEDSGEVLGRTTLEPDLRDVVLVDGTVQASRLRAASIVSQEGDRLTLPTTLGMKPHVAWRTWADEQGRMIMLHQLADPSPVPIDPEDSVGLPYGGGGFCQAGIDTPAITIVDQGVQTTPLRGASLTVDAALSPDGRWVALAMPGAPAGSSTLVVTPIGETECVFAPPAGDEGQVVSVAFDTDGTLVAQSREPARLVVLSNLRTRSFASIELEGESRFDTGHEIFHRATDSGLSCATCHPEGADDGFVWTFERLGKRRTQVLDIGLAGTAPFHWDGDMEDLDMIMDQVLTHRMGGMRQSKARQASFESWMFALQRPPADTVGDDPGLVQEGQERFNAYGCATCHHGPKLGGGSKSEQIGELHLQVPSLRRVSLRPPFMHDGRSRTLDDAVLDMIVTTTPSSDPPARDIEAISAYLRTL